MTVSSDELKLPCAITIRHNTYLIAFDGTITFKRNIIFDA